MPQPIVIANETGKEVALGSVILRKAQRNALAAGADLARHPEPAAAHEYETESDAIGAGLRLYLKCIEDAPDRNGNSTHASLLFGGSGAIVSMLVSIPPVVGL